jgi:hypothetical protein
MRVRDVHGKDPGTGAEGGPCPKVLGDLLFDFGDFLLRNP